MYRIVIIIEKRKETVVRQKKGKKRKFCMKCLWIIGKFFYFFFIFSSISKQRNENEKRREKKKNSLCLIVIIRVIRVQLNRKQKIFFCFFFTDKPNNFEGMLAKSIGSLNINSNDLFVFELLVDKNPSIAMVGLEKQTDKTIEEMVRKSSTRTF